MGKLVLEKTFTMEGDTSTPEKYGIVPRSVDKILDILMKN